MVELVVELGVPDTVPVEELMLKPDGNEGEIVKFDGPPLLVTVKFVIAVPTVALIVEVDKVIDGVLTYLTITTPDPPSDPLVEAPCDPPPPPPPVFAFTDEAAVPVPYPP